MIGLLTYIKYKELFEKINKHSVFLFFFIFSAKAVSLQKIPDMEMFADDKKYLKVNERKFMEKKIDSSSIHLEDNCIYHFYCHLLQTQSQLGIRVIGFNSPLYYANGDMFVKQVFQIVGLKPERARKQIKRLGSILEFRRVVSSLFDISVHVVLSLMILFSTVS